MKRIIIISFILGLVVGFFLKKQDYKVMIKEVKGDVIKEVVNVPFPTLEHFKLDISNLPHYVFKEIIKVDTVTSFFNVDTLAILKDYLAVKKYSYTLFNNEHGKLILNQNTQYNSIVTTSYNYEPRKLLETKLKRWQLLIGAGYSSSNYIGPTVGILYKNIGLFGSYRYNFNDQKNTIDLGLLFRI